MRLRHGTHRGATPDGQLRKWLPGVLATAAVFAVAGLTAAQQPALQPRADAPKPMPTPAAPGDVVPRAGTGGQAAAPTQPPEKTVSVNFKSVQWDYVLDWFSNESGLTPIYSVKPTGSVTLQPPKDKKFTMGEVIDLLNEAMLQQKFILVRRQVSFTILPSDEKIDFSQIPRIELSELPRRGKTELVQVLLPLKTLAVEDTMPEVQKMLTPFGVVSMLAKMNTLVIVDTAGNITRIHQTIQTVEEGVEGDTLTHKFKYVKADDVGTKLLTLLLDRADNKKPVKGFSVTVDARTNSVLVVGQPHKIALAKKLIEELDRPAKPGDPPLTLPEPEIRKYPVPAGTADAVAKKLLADQPSLRVIALPTTNEIIVLATPEEHAAVASKIKDFAESKK